MKSALTMTALLAAVDAALMARAPEADAPGPYTVKDKAAAISSVMAVMSANKPQQAPHASSVPHVKTVTATEIFTTKLPSPTKKATTKAAPKPETHTSAKKITSEKKTTSTKKITPPKTTTPAKLPNKTGHAKRDNLANYAACGVGSPVTATLNCNSGWACQSVNAFYYQCLQTTQAYTPPPVATPVVTQQGYAACGQGSPIAATNDCVNGWSCQSVNAFYYQCLSATSSTRATTTAAAVTTTTTTTTTTTRTTTTTTAAANANSNANIAVVPNVPNVVVVPVTTTTAVTTPTTSVTLPTTTSIPSVTVPTTTLQTTTSTTTTLGANDACGPQPNFGYTYRPTATAPAGWMADSIFNGASTGASTPAGYTWSFQGLYASVNQGGYMGVTTLSSYTPATCAGVCDTMGSCRSFVIYYERTPSVNPAPACLAPTAQTVVKCTFYDAPVNYTVATNVGEWRGNFAVVISGANAYSK